VRYFVTTRDGSRLGLDELLGRMERNGARQTRITFSRGTDDLIRLDAFAIETDEAGLEVLREYVAGGRIELKAISDTAGPDSKSLPSPDPSPDAPGSSP
jgi:hypothetical protein